MTAKAVPTLQGAYLAFFRAALDYLSKEPASSHSPGGKEVVVPTFEDVVDSENRFGISTRTRRQMVPDWGWFVSKHADALNS